VEWCDNVVGSGYSNFVGASDFMECRCGTAMGEETALSFEEAVVRFRVNVIGAVGAGFVCSIYPWWRCGGGGERVLGTYV
jgi:hypothetical protein